jgi:hypothetical protein
MTAADWSIATTGSIAKAFAVAYDGTKWVAAGEAGLLMTSPTGVNWTNITPRN